MHVGAKVVRKPEYRTSLSWALGDATLTVTSINHRTEELQFEEEPGIWWVANRFQLAEDTKPAVQGRKDDSGKLDMTLLDDMPRAIKAVVEVMQWAITSKKPAPYERGSWQGVHPDRYRAAIQRHYRDANEQATGCPKSEPARYQGDKETNLLHLAHIATSALMALENTIREMEENNAVSK